MDSSLDLDSARKWRSAVYNRKHMDRSTSWHLGAFETVFLVLCFHDRVVLTACSLVGLELICACCHPLHESATV